MIELLIAGDFVPSNRIVPLIERGDSTTILSRVMDFTKTSDYSIVNYESPVVIGDSGVPIKKTGPNLKSSFNALKLVQKAGFDCITLANNHFYDYGEDGVSDTIKSCDILNLDYLGGGQNDVDAAKILYKKIKGKVIAFINVCENEWSIASKEKGGSSALNPVKNYYQIQEANQKSDYVIVITHGGSEFYNLPTPRMQDTYRFFIDVGADVVVNHHQHCYSGYEVYNGGKIFYGLGNFCFDRGAAAPLSWNLGQLLKLSISDKISFELIPYEQCRQNLSVDFNVDKEQFFEELSRLNSVISSRERLNTAYQELISKQSPSYLEYIEPYTSSFFQKLRSWRLIPSLMTEKKKALILALSRCESHRDLLISVLENNLRKD